MAGKCFLTPMIVLLFMFCQLHKNWKDALWKHQGIGILLDGLFGTGTGSTVSVWVPIPKLSPLCLDRYFLKPWYYLLGTPPMQGERWFAWIDEDREPTGYPDLCRFHDLFLHAGWATVLPSSNWIACRSCLCWMRETVFLTVHLSAAGKFGALFASIPFTIFAAVYCVLFGLVG